MSGIMAPTGIVLVTQAGSVKFRDGFVYSTGESGAHDLAWATPAWVATAYSMRLQQALLDAGVVPKATDFPFRQIRG